LEAMAHLPCVGVSRAELLDSLAAIRAAGIDNVLALRGDPPRGEREFVPHQAGLAHASDLVQLCQEFAASSGRSFTVGAACYPEGHVECRDPVLDLRHTKLKVEAGASFLITQLFFDNRVYFDFVAAARAAGIDVPIIAGVMPITSYAQIVRFCEICEATIPDQLATAMEALDGDDRAEFELGVAYAAAQCAELLRGGGAG